jgi:NADH dehydrogenase (ubiquinone) 1 alpha subcomplex subunit 10
LCRIGSRYVPRHFSQITVEGSHAIGKSKFAKELAEELGMIYVEYPRMDDYFINPYGYDIRKVADLLPERMKPYDEKDFSRNPLGPVPGSADRMLLYLFKLKFLNHVYAIRHILNTGKKRLH